MEKFSEVLVVVGEVEGVGDQTVAIMSGLELQLRMLAWAVVLCIAQILGP